MLVIFLYMFLASVFPAGRIAMRAADPLFFTGVRMMLGGIILIGYQYCMHGTIFPKFRTYIWYILMLTIFNIILTNVPEFWALKFVQSGKASFIYSISPFFAAFLSYFLFNERLSGMKIVGMCIGFAGFTVLLFNQTPLEEALGGIGFVSWAEISLLVAACATVYGWIVMRQLIQLGACSVLAANGLSMLLAGILITAISPFFEIWNPVPVYSVQPFLLTLLYITLASNLIGYNLYGFLLKKYTATFLSFAGFIQPFFAAFYGWYFLNEHVSWYFYIASCIVFIGLFIFYTQELKQEYKIESIT